MPTESKKVYGVIGHPLGHSFSRTYFNDKFAAEGINAEYVNFDLPDIGDLPEAIAEYPRLGGLNVTSPYKQLVMPYLNSLDPVAKEVGAVNVIKFVGGAEGRFNLKGYNTDVYGFTESLRPLLGNRRRALVLGTGGAAQAVAYSLRRLGAEPTLVSRAPRRGGLTYAELTPQVMADNLLVVNATPVGMYPRGHECPDIPYGELTPRHLCYDLIYNPENTLFMRRAAQAGAQVKNGLEMLLLQAFESWRIWNE